MNQRTSTPLPAFDSLPPFASCQPAAPPPSEELPPVLNCCEALDDVTGRLRARLQQLGKRVAPVLKKDATGAGRPVREQPGSCDVVRRLHSCIVQLYALEDQMTDLIDALEV